MFFECVSVEPGLVKGLCGVCGRSEGISAMRMRILNNRTVIKGRM